MSERKGPPPGVPLHPHPLFVKEETTGQIDLIDDPALRTERFARKTDKTTTGIEQQLREYADRDAADHQVLHDGQAALHAGQAALTTEMTGVKTEIAGVKSEMRAMRGGISELSTHVMGVLERSAEVAHVKLISTVEVDAAQKKAEIALEVDAKKLRRRFWWSMAKRLGVGLLAILSGWAAHWIASR